MEGEAGERLAGRAERAARRRGDLAVKVVARLRLLELAPGAAHQEHIVRLGFASGQGGARGDAIAARLGWIDLDLQLAVLVGAAGARGDRLGARRFAPRRDARD